MPCGEEAGKGEELYPPGFRGPDSKGNSREFALGVGGAGQVPSTLGPATSLSHLNVQNQNLGKQSGILTLLINVLKLSCGPEEGLPEHSSLHRGNQRK